MARKNTLYIESMNDIRLYSILVEKASTNNAIFSINSTGFSQYSNFIYSLYSRAQDEAKAI